MMDLKAGLAVEVEGHPTEFGVPRKFDLYMKGPENGTSEDTGVLLVVHNRGEEAGHSYFSWLRREWANRFNVIAAGVDYLGSRASSRPVINVQVPADALARLRDMLPEGEEFEKAAGSSDVTEVLKALEGRELVQYATGITVVNEALKEDDYWDFGLVQALDFIYAYRIILEMCRDNGWAVDERRAFVYGYGDGGHIAQMCGRLAPRTFALIADQGGKVMAYPRDMVPIETANFKLGVIPGYNIKTWLIYPELYRLGKDSSHPVTQDMIQIRNLTRLMPETGCRYVMCSHSQDRRSREVSREYLAEQMKKAGIEVDHHTIDESECVSENRVDIKKLFEEYCGDIIGTSSASGIIRQGKSDFELGSRITYQTAHGQYVIDYSGFVPRLSFEGEVVVLEPNDII